MSSDRIDPPEFVERMAPTVSVLHTLCSAIVDAPTRNGHLAREPSVAMDDLAAEERYMRALGPDWELALVRDTHTFGSMTLVAATDYSHCYASLFEGDRVPVYGHLALTRAALEACVVSLWLNDPKASTVRCSSLARARMDEQSGLSQMIVNSVTVTVREPTALGECRERYAEHPRRAPCGICTSGAPVTGGTIFGDVLGRSLQRR